MSQSASTAAEPAAQTNLPLTSAELRQLTFFKWRYAFEAFGFEGDEVRELMFLKWLHVSGRLEP